jgi:hypothetical protein
VAKDKMKHNIAVITEFSESRRLKVNVPSYFSILHFAADPEARVRFPALPEKKK